MSNGKGPRQTQRNENPLVHIGSALKCDVWRDDSVVIKGSSIKLWAKPHESPGTTVLIRPYTAP